MRSMGWTLIQSDWAHYKRVERTERDGHVRTRGEEGCLHPKERPQKEPALRHPDLRLPASSTESTRVVQAALSVAFVTVAPH